VKTVPSSPNESGESLTPHTDQLSSADRAAAFAKWAPRVLALAAIGLVALLASLLPLGDLRIVAQAIAYFGGLCVVSFGYIYATFVWRLPGLHWLGFMPPILLALICLSVQLLGSEHFDALGAVVHVARWIIGLLMGLLLLGAAAGWLAYWHHRKPN
jgi:hypothetical protein